MFGMFDNGTMPHFASFMGGGQDRQPLGGFGGWQPQQHMRPDPTDPRGFNSYAAGHGLFDAPPMGGQVGMVPGAPGSMGLNPGGQMGGGPTMQPGGSITGAPLQGPNGQFPSGFTSPFAQPQQQFAQNPNNPWGAR